MHAANRSNNFDLIRLLAATQVMVSHAIGHTHLLQQLSGWQRQVFDWLVWLPGVPIFFVISGFLITKSYERSAGDVTGYFWNRFLRIFPALWVCLAVTVTVLYLFGFLPSAFVHSGTFFAWLAGQISFVQFFNPDQFRGFGLGVANGALWTITVELQFYVFIPLFCTFMNHPRIGSLVRRIGFATLFCASFVAWCVMNVKVNGPGGFTAAPLVFKMLQNTLIPHLWMFMVGIFIHRNFAALQRSLEGKFLPWFAAYAILAVAMQWFIPAYTVPHYALLLIARVLLGVATIAGAYTLKSLSANLLRGNDISYGLYIYHLVVINVFIQKDWLQSFSALPGIFATSIAIAFLSWILVEKPALACKNVSPKAWLAKRFPARIKATRQDEA